MNQKDQSKPSNLNYVVITPVRNEAAYIRKTIESIVNQTVLPMEWVIVDDGSTDDTPVILGEAAQRYSWIKVVNRPDRGFRKSGGGVIEAFNDGYAVLSSTAWSFICKLDGDLSFDPIYFEECLKRFQKNPKLGIAGGTVWSLVAGKLMNDGRGDPKFHVRGATKIYRRECWEKIHPLVSAPGWDTIDEVKANMLGWVTLSFKDLFVIQHKPTGSADGKWRNWFKNGQGSYVAGYHPLFMLGKCLKRTFRGKNLVEPAALWMGFWSGYLKGIPRVDDAQVVCYLRKQQLRRLFGLASIYD